MPLLTGVFRLVAFLQTILFALHARLETGRDFGTGVPRNTFQIHEWHRTPRPS